MKKNQLHKILFLVCFWILCAIFNTFYDESFFGYQSTVEGENNDFLSILITTIIGAFVGGTALGIVEVLVLSKLLRKKSFGITLLCKSLVYMLFMFFFISVAWSVLYSRGFGIPFFSIEMLEAWLNFISTYRFYMLFLYWGLASISALFILQVNDKFGQGILFNFMLGKYHRPKEENQIFMFMDLKSSTTYAEQLGHIKYSLFIQDCFYDISELITKYNAKIYQYVGDEIVLTWNFSDGFKDGNCINIFIAFDRLLNRRREYYLGKYGVIPEFKAGLNMGKVSVAEVGVIKKELAYHGDALNTASRIQDKCSELQKRILISGSMKNQLEKLSSFSYTFLGNIMLKGKTETVDIYEVLHNKMAFS
ncbi:MAG: adenylate/guanylate cyclase domain-containing protein [Mariniphaga sp.]|nr:adenylate/guanylate cyclase domain-containing protein [Mariniphaga sp.]